MSPTSTPLRILLGWTPGHCCGSQVLQSDKGNVLLIFYSTLATGITSSYTMSTIAQEEAFKTIVVQFLLIL